MKKIIIVLCLILGAALYSQQPNNNKSDGAPSEQTQYVRADEYNRVLSAFTDTALKNFELEKDRAAMMQTIEYARALVADLSKVKTIEELDKVRDKYQIPKPEKPKAK